MVGSPLLQRRKLGAFAALTSLFLVSCASTQDPDAAQRCQYKTILDDSISVCLGFDNILRVAMPGTTPRLSAPLPIDSTRTLRQVYTIGAGFNAFWIGFSGHPFGVIRVDTETLEATAKIRIDTGRDSRFFGSMGTITVGSRSVYALSEGRLHRIDPNHAAVVASVEYRAAGDVFADGDQLWLAQGKAVSRLDPDTLAELDVYVPPLQTVVGWGRWNGTWPEHLPTFVRDANGMKVVLSSLTTRDEIYRGTGLLQFGRLDPATMTIVVTEGKPLPHEVAPVSYPRGHCFSKDCD